MQTSPGRRRRSEEGRGGREKPSSRGMNSEIRPPANQPRHRALALIAARPDFFSLRGAVVASWRYKNGCKLGPYFRLFYREEGRQHSIYLGREGPLVRQVRAELARLQHWVRQKRAYRRARAAVTASLRRAKAELDRRLRPWGLCLKGYEVRGWRSHPVLRSVSGLLRMPSCLPSLRLGLPPPLPATAASVRGPRLADFAGWGPLRW